MVNVHLKFQVTTSFTFTQGMVLQELYFDRRNLINVYHTHYYYYKTSVTMFIAGIKIPYSNCEYILIMSIHSHLI